MDDRERSRATRVRAGRWISTGGLIGLGVALFLPQVRDSRYHPAEAFGELFDPLPSLFACAMLLVYLLRSLWRRDRAQRALSHAAAAAALAALFLYQLWNLYNIGITRRWHGIEDRADLPAGYMTFASYAWGSTAVLAMLLVFAAWFAVRPAARTPLLVSLMGFVYFIYLLVFACVVAGYGIWVSLASCALLVVGGVIEVFALRRAPYENTLADSPPTR
jgi:hypothetical protein